MGFGYKRFKRIDRLHNDIIFTKNILYWGETYMLTLKRKKELRTSKSTYETPQALLFNGVTLSTQTRGLRTSPLQYTLWWKVNSYPAVIYFSGLWYGQKLKIVHLTNHQQIYPWTFNILREISNNILRNRGEIILRVIIRVILQG